MLEQGLVALLAGNAGVAALVGARIYPVQGPPDDAEYPCITYQNATGESDYTFEGAECRSGRIDFALWGTAYGDGKNVANALRNALSGFSGTLEDGTRILFAKRLNYLDNFDVNARSYRSVAEYEFLFVEP